MIASDDALPPDSESPQAKDARKLAALIASALAEYPGGVFVIGIDIAGLAHFGGEKLDPYATIGLLTTVLATRVQQFGIAVGMVPLQAGTPPKGPRRA